MEAAGPDAVDLICRHQDLLEAFTEAWQRMRRVRLRAHQGHTLKRFEKGKWNVFTLSNVAKLRVVNSMIQTAERERERFKPYCIYIYIYVRICVCVFINI